MKKSIVVIQLVQKNGFVQPLFVVDQEERKYKIKSIHKIKKINNGFIYECNISYQLRCLIYENKKWYIDI